MGHENSIYFSDWTNCQRSKVLFSGSLRNGCFMDATDGVVATCGGMCNGGHGLLKLTSANGGHGLLKLTSATGAILGAHSPRCGRQFEEPMAPVADVNCELRIANCGFRNIMPFLFFWFFVNIFLKNKRKYHLGGCTRANSATISAQDGAVVTTISATISATISVTISAPISATISVTIAAPISATISSILCADLRYNFCANFCYDFVLLQFLIKKIVAEIRAEIVTEIRGALVTETAPQLQVPKGNKFERQIGARFQAKGTHKEVGNLRSPLASEGRRTRKKIVASPSGGWLSVRKYNGQFFKKSKWATKIVYTSRTFCLPNFFQKMLTKMQEKYSWFFVVKMWWFSVKLHFLEILHCIFFKCKAFSMFRICFDILQPYSSYFLQKDPKKHETFLFSISIGRLYRFAFGCLTKRVLDIETGAMGSGRNGGHGLSAPWARRNGGHGLWAQRGLSAPRANCKLRKPIAK